ncbi:MAG: V-type ATP synthase subunit E family protein [Candidatus Woesearchaeota archaeon]
MGLEEVKKDIIENAEKEARKIIEAANHEAEKITAKAVEEAGKIRDEAEEKAMKDVESVERKELAVANLEAKKEIFRRKKIIINKVIEEAKRKVESMLTKDKESLLRKIMSKAAKQLEIEYVYCSKAEASIIKKIAKKGTTIIDSEDISGGIIAENKDKTLSINYSYKSIFDDTYEELLQELAQTLF